MSKGNIHRIVQQAQQHEFVVQEEQSEAELMAKLPVGEWVVVAYIRNQRSTIDRVELPTVVHAVATDILEDDGSLSRDLEDAIHRKDLQSISLITLHVLNTESAPHSGSEEGKTMTH